MARTGQQTAAAATAPLPAGEQAEIQRLVEELDGMLSRLRLGAIREQLDGLLEEAARRQLNLREALAWLCAAEIASKEQRRLSMAMTIAHFPFVRTLEGFEFEAQPSIDPGKIRDLATCRWVANGDFTFIVDLGRLQQRLCRLQRVRASGGTHLLDHIGIVRHHQFIQGRGFLHIGQNRAACQA